MRILNLNTFSTYFVDIANFAGDVHVLGIIGLGHGTKLKLLLMKSFGKRLSLMIPLN